LTKALGFTGSRKGMTENQLKNFVYLLGRLQPTEIHLGDCVGADEEAFKYAKMFRPEMTFIGHIPSDDKLRAFCQYDVEWEPKDYLARNRDIVDCSQVIIATPRSNSKGTNYTIRYAETQGKKTYVL
jgi:hypothetical protein